MRLPLRPMISCSIALHPPRDLPDISPSPLSVHEPLDRASTELQSQIQSVPICVEAFKILDLPKVWHVFKNEMFEDARGNLPKNP